MGHRGNPGHPEVQAAIEAAMNHCCQRQGGRYADLDLALAQRYLQLGCSFVAVGVDVLMFVNAARKLRTQFAGFHGGGPGTARSRLLKSEAQC
jgi:4-hydroxy-2-oxoheptanedioate aldolase